MGCGASQAAVADVSPAQLSKPPAAFEPLASPEVYAWLNKIGLAEYSGAFAAAGCTTLAEVAALREADIIAMGVQKLGHQKKLAKQCATMGAEPSGVEPAPTTAPRVVVVDENDTSSLAPKIVLRSDDPVPADLRAGIVQGETRARLYKSVYPANAPCEDRHTVVVGDGFIFAGVWDGHGGHYCSEYAEDHIFANLKHEHDANKGSAVDEMAWAKAFKVTDREYLRQTKREVKAKQKKAFSLFAGTCAVGGYIDLASRRVDVANLGDSRVVIGLYEPTGLRTVLMSHDQTADDEGEIKRLKMEHPADRTILINKGNQSQADWRVKGICQFTRSIGDNQMKDRAVSVVYNTYTRGSKVLPTPGTGATAPYIIHRPDYREQEVGAGFVLWACDGLWDEMSSEEAVSITARLLREHPEPEADVAAMLVDEALQKVARRICTTLPAEAAQIFSDPSAPKLAELRALPQGKKQITHRSCLHDDITVIIVVLSAADLNLSSLPESNSTAAPGAPPPAAPLPRATEASARKMSESELDQEDVDAASASRQTIDRQILTVIDVASGMSAAQLHIIFDALDVDPKNGELSREECSKLAAQVLGDDAVDQAVVDAVWSQMDSDSSGVSLPCHIKGTVLSRWRPLAGGIHWENFQQFFDVVEGSAADAAGVDDDRSVVGFQKLYGLLAGMPLMEGVSQHEQEELTAVRHLASGVMPRAQRCNSCACKQMTLAGASQVLEKVTFADGEAIMVQGEEGDCMYIIESGAAEATIEGVNDGAPVMSYATGAYFGELALRAKQPRCVPPRDPRIRTVPVIHQTLSPKQWPRPPTAARTENACRRAATVRALGEMVCMRLGRREFQTLVVEKKGLAELRKNTVAAEEVLPAS
jgi:serine/threonine protein phosphatase PrpC/CRP-like cAMP-binding protein